MAAALNIQVIFYKNTGFFSPSFKNSHRSNSNLLIKVNPLRTALSAGSDRSSDSTCSW
jgi:hypothetical protein